jgi:nucleotide-binding universal stress UspA family protein
MSEVRRILVPIDFSEHSPADLIVIGTRGPSGLKHVVLGSVAERTIRNARCPVLSVKRPKARQEAGTP